MNNKEPDYKEKIIRRLINHIDLYGYSILSKLEERFFEESLIIEDYTKLMILMNWIGDDFYYEELGLEKINVYDKHKINETEINPNIKSSFDNIKKAQKILDDFNEKNKMNKENDKVFYIDMNNIKSEEMEEKLKEYFKKYNAFKEYNETIKRYDETNNENNNIKIDNINPSKKYLIELKSAILGKVLETYKKEYSNMPTDIYNGVILNSCEKYYQWVIKD